MQFQGTLTDAADKSEAAMGMAIHFGMSLTLQALEAEPIKDFAKVVAMARQIASGDMVMGWTAAELQQAGEQVSVATVNKYNRAQAELAKLFCETVQQHFPAVWTLACAQPG